jgi:hypothetical protein
MLHIHACYKHIFQVFSVVFVRMFASVLSRCCICLQCFSDVFQTLVSSVSSVSFCMLQLLHRDVSNVDRVLHNRYAWEATDDADDVWGGVGDARGSAGPLLMRSLASHEPDTLGARK